MNYWLHRISHHSEISYPLLDNNILTIGFSDFADNDFIINIRNGKIKKRKFNEIVKWGDNENRTRDNLWRFIKEFKTSDWVIVPFSDTFDIYEIVSDKPEPIGNIKEIELKKYIGDNYKISKGLIYLNNQPIDIGFYWKVKSIAKGVSRNKYANKNLANKMRNRYTNAKISDVSQDIKEALLNFNKDKNKFEANKDVIKLEDIFFTKVEIKNVRHLKNINIHLSSKERKHLIFTGKNGSGKTSVLESLKNYLSCLSQYEIPDFFPYSSKLDKKIDVINDELLNNEIYRQNIEIRKKADECRDKILQKAKNKEITIEEAKEQIKKCKGIDIDEGLPEDLKEKIKQKIELLTLSINEIENSNYYHYNEYVAKIIEQIIAPFNKLPIKEIFKGKFIISYFGAKRSGEPLNIPKGINKFEQPQMYNITDKSNKDFIQFLVNMKADRSFAKDENNYEIVKQIDEWFEVFDSLLQEIFENNNISLKFDFTNYNFNILLKNREPFDFSTLSDGYSAIFNIVTELMMRMENHKAKLYDLQGIVLIDEIETHLHVELQKKILPFLTKFFPNIQFIVTTHSPFILNSISNAVIYDLEKHIREEDFSAFAYDGIVETYLDNDKYSKIAKIKLERYKELLFNNNLNADDKNELRKLEYYFENIPAFVAPELISVFQNLQIQKLNEND